jgi:hypothetical protein
MARCPAQGSSTLHGTNVHVVLSKASQKAPSNSMDHDQTSAISFERGRPPSSSFAVACKLGEPQSQLTLAVTKIPWHSRAGGGLSPGFPNIFSCILFSVRDPCSGVNLFFVHRSLFVPTIKAHLYYIQ